MGWPPNQKRREIGQKGLFNVRLSLMKRNLRSRNTIKIIDLQQELGLTDQKLAVLMRAVNIRLEEDQKNLDQNEAGKIRQYLHAKRRREEMKQKPVQLPSIVKVSDFAKAMELSVG